MSTKAKKELTANITETSRNKAAAVKRKRGATSKTSVKGSVEKKSKAPVVEPVILFIINRRTITHTYTGKEEDNHS